MFDELRGYFGLKTDPGGGVDSKIVTEDLNLKLGELKAELAGKEWEFATAQAQIAAKKEKAGSAFYRGYVHDRALLSSKGKEVASVKDEILKIEEAINPKENKKS